jgi:hypothetical protein
MSRYEWDTWEDKDLYDQGRRDAEYGRTADPSYSRYSDSNSAYFDGFDEAERRREEEKREAEFEEESQRLHDFKIEQENAEYERELEREQEEEFDRDRREERSDIDD